MAKLISRGELKHCKDCGTDEILSFSGGILSENPKFIHYQGNYYCVPCGWKYTKKVSFLTDWKNE